MAPHLERETTVFVIRIWVEYLREQPPVWRGEVYQALTGESAYFRSISELRRFLETQALAAAHPGKEVR